MRIHKRPVGRVVLGTVALWMVLVGSASAANTGLAFLKNGVDAHGVVFGEAMTAHVTDATACYWNPAGLASLDHPQLVLSHVESFADLRHEYGAIAQPLGEGGTVAGLYFNGLWTDDIDGYDSLGNPSGTFGYAAYAVGVSLSHTMMRGVQVGVTGKYLSESISDYSASGFAGDVGLQWVPWEDRPVRFGAAVRNIGPSISFIDEEVDLPLTIQGGLAYIRPLDQMNGQVTVAAELRNVRDQGTSFHGGLEYDYRETLRFGVGYQDGLDTRDVSVGLGMHQGRFAFDWAYVPVADDLGDEHRFTVRVDM